MYSASSQTVQPGTDCTAWHIDCFCAALSAGMYLFCHYMLHLHTSQRSLYDDLRLHFRTAVVHLRNFLAGSRHTQILGSGVMDIPIDLRYQRFCPDKQHGGHTARSHTRIPCLMDPGRSIFPDRMPGLPVSDPSEPIPCHQTYLSVQKEKTF